MLPTSYVPQLRRGISTLGNNDDDYNNSNSGGGGNNNSNFNGDSNSNSNNRDDDRSRRPSRSRGMWSSLVQMSSTAPHHRDLHLHVRHRPRALMLLLVSFVLFITSTTLYHRAETVDQGTEFGKQLSSLVYSCMALCAAVFTFHTWLSSLSHAYDNDNSSGRDNKSSSSSSSNNTNIDTNINSSSSSGSSSSGSKSINTYRLVAQCLSPFLFLFSFYLVLNVAYTRNNDTPLSSQMNEFLFILLCVGIMSLLALFWVFKHCLGWRRGLLLLLSLVCVLLAYVVLGSMYYQSHWNDGLFGRHINNDMSACTINKQASYVDLLPRRAMNFYTGSEACAPVPSFSALTNGVLTMQCDSDGSYLLNNEGAVAMDHENDVVDRVWSESIRRYGPQKAVTVTSPSVVTRVNTEYVIVQCGADKNMLLSNKENATLIRHKRARSPSATTPIATTATRAAAAPPPPPPITSSSPPSHSIPPNLLVFNFDALSRKNFLRRLPRTAEFLDARGVRLKDEQDADGMPRKEEAGKSEGAQGEKVVEGESPATPNRYDAFQFLRYHSLGANTKWNLTPMMTGHPYNTFRTLKRTGEVRTDKRKHTRRPVPEDLWWYQYRGKDGLSPDSHVTAWLYEMCADPIKDLWQFNDTVHLDHEVVLPFCHEDYESARSNFEGPYSITSRCLAGRHVHDYVFDYWKSFMKNYRGIGKIGVAALMEAHEGSLAVISTIDESLRSFLEWMERHRGHDTVIALLSDHGCHMGPYYDYSVPGRQENKLPVLFTLVPRALTKRYPAMKASLLHNEQTLVTPFDLYATFHHLAHYPTPFDPSAMPSQYGHSMLEEIPRGSERTCADAPMSTSAYCACGV